MKLYTSAFSVPNFIATTAFLNDRIKETATQFSSVVGPCCMASVMVMKCGHYRQENCKRLDIKILYYDLRLSK
jgi:hypothetical protein